MSSRTRLIVLAISAPVIAFAIVGGFLGKVMAREDTYQHLKIFDDVASLISSNYVEEVNVDKVMHGAMHGLADALDPDSAYLTADEVKLVESNAARPAGDIGLELTRQYYLPRHRGARQLACRQGRPAHGRLHPRDQRHADARDVGVGRHARAARRAGLEGQPHHHPRQRRRPARRRADPRGAAGVRCQRPHRGARYRIPAHRRHRATAGQVKTQVADLAKAGATKLLVDVRRTSTGAMDQGLAIARLFVASGTLAIRESRNAPEETFSAGSGDGAIKLPTVVLVDTGTAGAGALRLGALAGNKRADLIGEHTIGRAADQKLVKLPDGSGLWLSTARYLTPAGAPLHAKGLEPTVTVDQPEVEFGQPAPTADPVLDKAIERLSQKQAA